MEKDPKPLNTISDNSLNCNTWNLNNFKNISYAHLGCPKCVSNLGFSFLFSKIRQGIDVVAPAGISMPKFSDYKLVPVDIKYPVVKCLCCNDVFKVVPDFISKGTTLTLAAQALIAVLYHGTINATWRNLSHVLGGEAHGIAHTTLYRAYHSFGKNLLGMKDSLSRIIEENSTWNLNSEIPRKAEKNHTKKCETVIVSFLLILWLSIAENMKIFWKNFWKLLDLLTGKTSYTENFKISQIHRKNPNTS